MPDRFVGFEWDFKKSDWTLRNRGFDFETAAMLFKDTYIEAEDRRRNYGEPRYTAIGHVGDTIVFLVWTPRGDRRRIISARMANEVRELHMANTEQDAERIVIVNGIPKKGRIDYDLIARTTEADIARHALEDDHPKREELGSMRIIYGADVAGLRSKFGLSQQAFAAKFGLSLRTVQEWEQKRRVPDGATRLLLQLIEDEPETVARVATRSRRSRQI